MSRRRRTEQQAIARLHQMACLDFNGPQLIASVLNELRHIIEFDSGSYFYLDKNGELEGHVESADLLAAMPDYFDAHVLRSERRLLSHSLLDFSARPARGPITLEPGQLLTVPRTELYRSDYYDAIMRPANLSTWACLRLHTPQGRTLGKLALYRNSGAPQFTRQEIATLAPLEACLSRVLQPGELDADDSEVQASGLLVATPDGRLLWTSPEAECLLPLAFGWRWRAASAAGAIAGRALPPALHQLLQRLQWAWQGKTGAPLPQMEWRNTNGAFSLRATRLTAAAGAPTDDAVALHITQRVPSGTRLLAALQALALPRRQQELAYWIARGHTETQIAARMGIGAPTVVHHRRALYDRLQVLDRRGLLARLSPSRDQRQ